MEESSIQDIKDFHEVIRLLEAHPEWRAELRRVILTDDLLQLPEQVQALVAVQRRTEEQLLALTKHVDGLTTQVTTLSDIVQRIAVDVGRLKGDSLEIRYARRGLPFMTQVVRRPHLLSPEELDTLLEAAEAEGKLSASESNEITLADLVYRGKRRSTGTDIYVVTEVSWGVGVEDVQRAEQRSRLLSKLGTPTLAAVAGEWVTPEAQRLAPELKVWQFTPQKVVEPSEV
ncbi:MAG: hypothetical protein AB7P18_33180 [Candidatus Binatia bacterium]